MSDLNDYLAVSTVIDFDHPDVAAKARDVKQSDPTATINACFEFVRDHIKHSSDYRLNPVTLSASEVLRHGTGYCYAKAHLLCALLRANDIPAGLCYQRLLVTDDGDEFCIHGLAAAWIPDIGWYRMDPRGNRDGIDAQFVPPREQLAFTTDAPGERDLPGVFPEPFEDVVACLQRSQTWEQVYEDLPDRP